jgi:hypothetical protein
MERLHPDVSSFNQRGFESRPPHLKPPLKREIAAMLANRVA